MIVLHQSTQSTKHPAQNPKRNRQAPAPLPHIRLGSHASLRLILENGSFKLREKDSCIRLPYSSSQSLCTGNLILVVTSRRLKNILSFIRFTSLIGEQRCCSRYLFLPDALPIYLRFIIQIAPTDTRRDYLIAVSFTLVYWAAIAVDRNHYQFRSFIPARLPHVTSTTALEDSQAHPEYSSTLVK